MECKNILWHSFDFDSVWSSANTMESFAIGFEWKFGSTILVMTRG